MAQFRTLDPARIVATADVLHRRVEERFPGSSLSRVAAELEAVTREAAALSHWMAKPHVPLRVAIGVLIALLSASVAVVLFSTRLDSGGLRLLELAQGLEALINDLVFVGIAVYFLSNLEVRMKRARALGALHVLRSLAHIVDMHQLTKDPERLVAGGTGAATALDTASSPKRTMTAFELTRYLDYSTEMLAIVSKVAALYVQEFNDPVTVSAASAVEDLAVNLSRTIWQKIVILDRYNTAEGARELLAPAP